MHIYIYIHKYTYIYICIYTYMSIHIYIYAYTYVNICIYTSVCMYVYKYIPQHNTTQRNTPHHDINGGTQRTLQHTAAHCSTLQHTATHCNTRQHTVTHCNTPHRDGAWGTRRTRPHHRHPDHTICKPPELHVPPICLHIGDDLEKRKRRKHQRKGDAWGVCMCDMAHS